VGINGHFVIEYWWLLMVIVLVAIGGYWWLFVAILLINIGEYSIVDIGGY